MIIAELGKSFKGMDEEANIAAALEHALSYERFARYQDWARGDRRRAVELYTLNTLISESLYTPLQMLEVALRNRIHAVMKEAHGERWFQETDLLLLDRQGKQVEKAIEEVRGAGKELTPGRIVAALTFSFWTSMFSPDYETLWQQSLHRIATRPDGKGLRRKNFSSPLRPIRTLRNRIAHHEPIITWNLPRHYHTMLEITQWLSPAAALWCRTHCRFMEVYPQERIILHDGRGEGL